MGNAVHQRYQCTSKGSGRELLAQGRRLWVIFGRKVLGFRQGGTGGGGGGGVHSWLLQSSCAVFLEVGFKFSLVCDFGFGVPRPAWVAK